MLAGIPIPNPAAEIVGYKPAVLRWYSTEVVPDTDRPVVIAGPNGASTDARYCAIRESFVVLDFYGKEICVSTSLWREV